MRLGQGAERPRDRHPPSSRFHSQPAAFIQARVRARFVACDSRVIHPAGSPGGQLLVFLLVCVPQQADVWDVRGPSLWPGGKTEIPDTPRLSPALLRSICQRHPLATSSGTPFFDQKALT